MGLFKRRCWFSPTVPAPNPDPSRYTIIRNAVVNRHRIVEVQYLDCTNYDGRKIMLYETAEMLRGKIDPHFNETQRSPIARFEPTERGWELACELAARF